ncbi:MAG TPA: ATP-binding cassette domain-containing protein [Frankiaceae bacterium]|jgi:ABC-2 type transport system ATP-binding protein|nr:ATP-binding cassette domain-containing protein [Frankiaceae bacterium]
MPPHAVEVADLRRTFVAGRGRSKRTIEAVDGISFTVEPGERLAYIGPNGAGKSTSIKMLTGILHPSGGSASVLGLVPWHQRRDLTRRIGTLFGQRSQLWLELTPRQSFRMLGAIYGLSDDAIARRVGELGELLDAADLFDSAVRGLSLGQRMRCELAACLLHEPEILFLDEPTIGLDLLGKTALRELLVRLNDERRTTIFLTSHDVADIEHVARRVIVINHGHVIYDDEVAAVRRTLLATKLVEVTLDAPAAPVALAGVTVTASTATTWELVVDTTVLPVRRLLDVLLETFPVVDLSVSDPPLEQVIAEIYAAPR